jgi:membrane-associated protease RseP (regulator of RpoE activity)
MTMNIRHALGLALMVGASALVSGNLARAQDAPASEPPQAQAQAQPGQDASATNLYRIGLQDNLDGSYAAAVLNYFAWAPQQAANEDWQRSFFYTLRDLADTTLGATLQPVDEGVRAQLGLEAKGGLVVSALADGGPAASAGLKQNDILLALADAPLAEVDDLPKQLKAVGEKDVPLKLLRAGKPLTIRVRPYARMTLGPAEPEKVDYYIGVSASPPDDVLRAHVELPAGQGLLITEVVPESPAEKAGVKKFDILLKLNDKPLDRPENLSKQVQAAGDKSTKLFLYRGGKPITITVKPEPRKTATRLTQWQEREAFRLWASDGTALNALHGGLWKADSAQPRHFRFTHQGQPLINQAAPGENKAANALVVDVTTQRLDTLDKEIKALRKTIEEIRDALKKGR